MLAATRCRASAQSGFRQVTGPATGIQNRHEWRRFDLRSALVTTALGTGVLVGASLWSPHEAAAGCVDTSSAPNEVHCDASQTTTNFTKDVTALGGADDDERLYLFTADGDVDVEITSTGDLDGYGLAVRTTQAGSAIIVDHEGAISVNAGNNPTRDGNAVFSLATSGGDITYTGNGSVIDNAGGNFGLVVNTNVAGGDIAIGASGDGVVPTWQGVIGLSTNSGTGNQTIFLDGGTSTTAGPTVGDGIHMQSSSGTLDLTIEGGTQLINASGAPGSIGGINARSTTGDITIASDAVIGTDADRFHTGFGVNSGGAVDVTHSGSIFASEWGIRAFSDETTEITMEAGSAISLNGTGIGIQASGTGDAGGVDVTVDGAITSADIGVLAGIDNAANPDNVVVTTSGSIEANVGSSISAITVGTGNASVNLQDGATMQGGVLAQSTTGSAAIVAGNNVTVDGNSPGMASITAGGDATVAVGDNALVTGSSGIVVDQTLAGGAGDATVVVGDNGVIADNDDDPLDDYDGNGIFAGNQGTGETSVTTGTATSVTGEANGIFASQTNAANINAITITTDGPVTGSGTDGFTLAPYTDAFDAAGLPTTGLGIGVSNEGTGNVIVSAGDTVTGSDTGIQVLAAGGAGSAIAITSDGAVVGTANTGILAETADGDIAITANADVTGGQEGIVADAGGTGNIAVTTGGSVEGTAAVGILTTTADGHIAVTANGDVTGGVQGIIAGAGGTGNVAVTTGGTVEGTGAVGILTQTADGHIAITANGDVTGGTNGILADAGGTGSIAVTTGGTVEGTAVTGILTTTDDGDISIAANGDVTGGTNGILADAGGTGNIAVTTGGTVAGATGNGILTVTADGDIAIAAGDDVTGGGSGIIADAGGTGNIAVTTDGTVAGTASTGILTTTGDGNIAVTANDSVIGANQGIQANAGGTGSVLVSAGGSVEGTTATGILTTTDAGDITVSASADVTGGNTGILASAGGVGNIAVTTGGAVEGTAATGILSQTNDGDIVIAAADTVTGGVEGILAIAGGTGNIDVTTDGAVEGTAATGIRAVTTDGDIAIAANDTVTGGDDGIVANAGGTGNIAVTAGGLIEGTADHGILAATDDGDITIAAASVIGGVNGVVANVGGTGNIGITATTAVDGNTGSGIVAVAPDGEISIAANAVSGGVHGIVAVAGGSGDVIVTSTGDVTGQSGDGISTFAESGNTVISANAEVTGGDDGIEATATVAGNIDVTVAGGAQVTGSTGAGVSTQTGTGTAAIDNAGVIEGAFAAISGATSTVLDVVNQAGGLIQNLSADIADLAISVTGTGVADIDNDGTIRGRLSLDAGDDTFDNSGLWATSGTSDFGAGTDSVTNTGHLSVAEQAAVAEITHLANLETFTNASTGVIDMVDDNAPNVGDELTIDGLYTGAPGSIIQMDLALVSGDPQAGSDLLVLDPANPATGTSDFLFNIVSTGVTATTADTNRVAFAGGQILAAPVTVVENRGTLATSSGDDDIPLARSGLITYDLVSTGNDYQVVSQFDAGLAGGLLLPIPATLATVAFTTQRTPNPITATCIDPDNKANAQGGWVRGLAGQFHTESAGEASVGGVTSDLESDNHTRFRTLQGGFDHVLCNIDSHGSTLHLGVTVGQTWGDSVQQDPDPAAGIFGTDVEFDTFFIGPYAAFTRGNFAAQASLRYDYHSLELTNPTVGIDADGLDVDAEGVSGAVSMTYDFALASLTLTPDVGVNVSNTEIDSFDIAGGTVVLDDLWSVMGHAGVTARTEPLGIADNLFVVPFASATLYHEFIDDADGAFDIGGTVIESEANRVGTFGQLGIGANAVRLGDVVAGRPTLFGGARFDLQVGERIEGATATVFGRVQF